MDYSDSTIAVSATVEEQAFSLPRRAVGPALRCQTNGLSAPVPRGYTNSGIALNVSKQCPTRALFSPAMTRVRAHQERLIHCLAIPFIICVLQSRSDSRIHAAILSVLDSGFEGNSSSSQVSSFLDPTGATTGKPADLLAAFGEGNYPAAYNHFIASGLNEGRASSVNFDVGFYLNHYPDLIAAFGPKNYPAAFDHWIVYGRGEGRQGAPGVLNSGFEQITSLTPGVLSPGFEGNSAQGWNLGYWGASSSVTSAQSHSGGYSLAQTGSTTGGSYQDVGGLVSGVTYQVSVWVRADSGTTAQAYLWVHDTTGANAGNTVPITPGQSWQQITLPYTADSTGMIRIHLHYVAGAGTIYYDDVLLRQYTSQGWNLGYWGASSSVTSAQSHSGGYSLAQTGSTTGGSYQDVGGLVSGVTYQVSVWVRADSGTTAQAYLWVHDTTEAHAAELDSKIPGQSWQQITLPYTADSTGMIRIHLHYVAGAGTIYYDDVLLRQYTSQGWNL